MSKDERHLPSPPTDAISRIRFGNRSNKLIASSWCKDVCLYDCDADKLLFKHTENSALLDCDFSPDDSKGFVGGLDGRLAMIDFERSTSSRVGDHKKAIRCVEYNEPAKMVLTGSWDETVKMWDTRAHDPLAGSHDLSGRVFAMCLSEYRLVVGVSDRSVYIFDVRSMNEPEQTRESSLKHQTRCIRANPDGSGYVLSSIEGRVAVEFFDTTESVQDKKYAFKCHRSTDQTGTQSIYPVNAITFHPIHHTFATGGSDGVVNIWDGENKKRICQFPSYPTSIASMDFNRDGGLLALAVSYTFDEGEKTSVPDDTIIVRRVRSPEVEPKVKKNSR